jgi:hypothetical protein
MDNGLSIIGVSMMGVAVMLAWLGLDVPQAVEMMESSPSTILEADRMFPGLASRASDDARDFYRRSAAFLAIAPPLFIAGAVLLAGGVVAGAATARPSRPSQNPDSQDS